MDVEFKDYYEILNIERTADKEEIRRAFRRLARKYHPDVSRDRPGAEDRFKEVNEANAVLSDPQKRAKYDELGADWKTQEPFNNSMDGAVGEDFEFHFAGTGFSDFFEKFFKENPKAQKQTSASGDDGPSRERRRRRSQPEAATDDDFDPEPFTDAEHTEPEHGADVEANLMISMEEALNGAVRPIKMRLKLSCKACDGRGGRCMVCKGSGKVLKAYQHNVRVPPNTKAGQILRLKGKGEKGPHGEPPGDLFLRVQIAAEPDVRVEDGEMVYDLDLAPWEAVLGNEVEINSPQGAVTIKVPPGIQNNSRMRLPGHGMPKDEDGKRGDLIIVTHIKMPTRMSRTEYALWKEIADKTRFAPREE